MSMRCSSSPGWGWSACLSSCWSTRRITVGALNHDHSAHDLGFGHGMHHVHVHASEGGFGLLNLALLLTLSFTGVEALAGWWSGSLVLLSDAAHMFTDSSALGLAAAAAWLARRPPSIRHSYGLVRAEVLAALINSLMMLVVLGYIVHEAIDRFSSPHAIAGGTVIGVAVNNLGSNLLVAWILSRGEHTLNSRAAAQD